MSALANWDSFYVIVSFAAGTLIGFQFVVITLVTQRPRKGSVKLTILRRHRKKGHAEMKNRKPSPETFTRDEKPAPRCDSSEASPNYCELCTLMSGPCRSGKLLVFST
jgi:hypothetical protein